MDISRIDKIIETCRNQQRKHGDNALVSFKVPYRAIRKSVRLFKDRGPFGVVVQNTDTGAIARFPADKVIEFLLKERALTLGRQLSVAKDAMESKQ